MKIAYFGIDLFLNCLETCIGNGFEVAKVFTFTNDPYDSVEKITQIAKSHNIPLATLSFLCYKKSREFHGFYFCILGLLVLSKR